MYISELTEDGNKKGELSFYCRMLNVSRQGFYKYLENRDRPWKYEQLVKAMEAIRAEDECNDTYGRKRMMQALDLKGIEGLEIPRERTLYRIMKKVGLSLKPKKNPNGITKADKLAQKADNLIKRDFKANKPLEKTITDITELKAKDGKLYVSALFDCYDLMALGLAMDTNMKTTLCIKTIRIAAKAYPGLKGAISHSDRGSQYTSGDYKKELSRLEIRQSMNSAGGRCHDNARCESMWARMKYELFYSRGDSSENYTVKELKHKIWLYYYSYWNNRRICSSNRGLPPAIKRKRYYESLSKAA